MLRRASHAAVAIAASFGATLAISESLAAQQCGIAPRVTLALVLSEPSAADGRNVSLGSGPGVGGRVSCRSTGPLGFDFSVDAMSLSNLLLTQLVAGGGLSLGRGDETRAGWFEIFARAGYGTTAEIGTSSAVLRDNQVGRSGPMLGAAARGGIPVGTRSSLFLELGVYRLFLRRTSGAMGAGGSDGSTGVTTLPISLGVEFAL